MAIELNITIEGEKQLSRRLRKIGEGVKDFSPELKSVSQMLTGVFKGKVFDTKGAVLNDPWPPLAASTIREKRRLGYPTDPLIRTGKMRGSFKKRVSPQEAEIWNATKYFKYHQSRKPRHHLPRRVMMKLTEDLKRSAIQIIHKGINKRMD